MTVPATTASPRPLGKGTLSRRLVLRTTALVAAVTVVLSLFTALVSFQIMRSELDGRLVAAAGRPLMRPSGDSDDAWSDPEGSGLIKMSAVVGQRGAGATYQGPAAFTQQSASDLLTQVAARTDEDGFYMVTLRDLGLYRCLVEEYGHNQFIIVGLPFSEVTNPLTRQVVFAALLTLGAIALSFIGARRVVQTSLRPLNRLAATATKVSGLPLESGDGNLPVRVDSRDADPASEVGQVGVAFNRMLDHVEDALAARHRSETNLRQFVADASHELRNPLAAIRGYTELSQRASADLPDDTAHALGRIDSESERMSALVEDLLLLARLDSQQPLDLQPTDVTEIVLNAVDDTRVAGADHTWELDLPSDALLARADAFRLHQVVANLLANARVHTPPGTRVVTSLRREADQVVITVKDNGPGVPPEVRDTVFERFTRADASRVRNAGGSSTGLGLAIVAAVVAAHHGTVSLESVPGNTAFTIRIPAA